MHFLNRWSGRFLLDSIAVESSGDTPEMARQYSTTVASDESASLGAEKGDKAMSYNVSKIEGIGDANAAKLEKADVRTVGDLLNMCCDTEGRRRVSEISGISRIQLLQWSHMADLMRVAGIGPEYSELLAASGVLTVKELSRRIPAHLAETMKEVKELKNLTRTVPSEKQVAKWVENAKSTGPKVCETPAFVGKRAA